MSAELSHFKPNENIARLEQLVCVRYVKFSKPTLMFSVLLSQMSYLNTEAGWIEGGMKKVWRKLRCMAWGNERRTRRIRMGWVELWKENTRKLIWMWCRFALMGEENYGNVDCADLLLYKETEVERTMYMAIVLWVDLAAVWKCALRSANIKCYQTCFNFFSQSLF